MKILSFLSALLMFALSLDAAEPKPPRAARSVHLGWSAPDGEIFYNEMVVEQSTPGSYFMAVGWNTGYFGIQELNAATNKVVIFSVWDPAKGDNPNAVPAEQRVEMLHSDPGVRIKRFGGEGTGGQSMWNYPWRLGETNRFCLRATVQGEKTAYAAYFHVPEEKRWKHLATFRTTTKGSPLKGYYSFVEDFRRDTKSVSDVRRARFGNGWVKAITGDWVALRQARFTASGASWEAKENINAGLSGHEFFLATGGDTRMTMKLREQIVAPTVGGSPPDVPAAFSGKPGEWIPKLTRYIEVMQPWLVRGGATNVHLVASPTDDGGALLIKGSVLNKDELDLLQRIMSMETKGGTLTVPIIWKVQIENQ